MKVFLVKMFLRIARHYSQAVMIRYDCLDVGVSDPPLQIPPRPKTQSQVDDDSFLGEDVS